MNQSPSKNNKKSPDQSQKSLKERIKLHKLSGVVNHPDVDPTKLTREQGLIITDYITQIKALEKEYDQQKALKQKIKEEQNMNQKKFKEQEDIWKMCLMECNDYILRQQEVNSYSDKAESNKYFFELYRNQQQ